MQRSPGQLGSQEFDVLVVGGGASGAATAREASLRGYRTALIEREDFSAGASAHCFKVVHGGIRYIQHGDVRRLRASCLERTILLRIAPHLVAPLPFAIPTYGRGKSSRWLLGTGMLLYDTLTADLRRDVRDPSRRIRPTRFLSRSETIELFPTVERTGLTGAAVFEDGQMYNPPRLVLGFAAAAAEMGATVANYIEAQRLIRDGTRVIGVEALDRLDGSRLEIRARLVINAAGPWAEGLLQASAAQYGACGTYSRDACFIVDRKYPTPMALAVQGQTRDSDALLARSRRHLFMVPWRGCTLVGVWHSVVPRDPDSVGLPPLELRQFIDEFNASYPAMALRESDVRRVDFGLVPFGEASRQQKGLSFGKQSRLIDHRAHGLEGLLSLISVRYTVARRDAAEALDLAARQLGHRSAGGDSGHRPLPGGDFPDFAASRQALSASRPEWVTEGAADGLIRNYGTHLERMLSLGERDAGLRRCFSGTGVTHAEAVFAVREEMAQRMTDIVFRRTEMGTGGHPGSAALEELQALLTRELRWSEHRAAQERTAVDDEFGRFLATPAPPLARARSA
ncbi:MAG TPA: FAD-dependent oxidoreductase [Steroidobacteraceae bacterium]|nr:FAD-dependent oxidoreductase [Steroidobacteraceae bacterium]